METFLLDLFSEFQNTTQRPLVVLDGIHHLFDVAWFPGFFNVLKPSISESADLLMMCRSNPPNPLWRLRSKQQLDVIDEKTLAFDEDEIVWRLKQFGRSQTDALRIHAETFGQVSKLLPYLRAS
jgi:ATP/maltotriose-dependent transcriptional regulator MalT